MLAVLAPLLVLAVLWPALIPIRKLVWSGQSLYYNLEIVSGGAIGFVVDNVALALVTTLLALIARGRKIPPWIVVTTACLPWVFALFDVFRQISHWDVTWWPRGLFFCLAGALRTKLLDLYVAGALLLGVGLGYSLIARGRGARPAPVWLFPVGLLLTALAAVAALGVGRFGLPTVAGAVVAAVITGLASLRRRGASAAEPAIDPLAFTGVAAGLMGFVALATLGLDAFCGQAYDQGHGANATDLAAVATAAAQAIVWPRLTWIAGVAVGLAAIGALWLRAQGGPAQHRAASSCGLVALVCLVVIGSDVETSRHVISRADRASRPLWLVVDDLQPLRLSACDDCERVSFLGPHAIVTPGRLLPWDRDPLPLGDLSTPDGVAALAAELRRLGQDPNPESAAWRGFELPEREPDPGPAAPVDIKALAKAYGFSPGFNSLKHLAEWRDHPEIELIVDRRLPPESLRGLLAAAEQAEIGSLILIGGPEPDASVRAGALSGTLAPLLRDQEIAARINFESSRTAIHPDMSSLTRSDPVPSLVGELGADPRIEVRQLDGDRRLRMVLGTDLPTGDDEPVGYVYLLLGPTATPESLAQAARFSYQEAYLDDFVAMAVYEPLHQAAIRQDQGEILRLLEAGHDGTRFYWEWRPLLHWAIEWGSARMVELLLDQGASPAMVDGLRNGPFEYTRDREIVDLLIARLPGKRPNVLEVRVTEAVPCAATEREDRLPWWVPDNSGRLAAISSLQDGMQRLAPALEACFAANPYRTEHFWITLEKDAAGVPRIVPTALPRRDPEEAVGPVPEIEQCFGRVLAEWRIPRLSVAGQRICGGSFTFKLRPPYSDEDERPGSGDRR